MWCRSERQNPQNIEPAIPFLTQGNVFLTQSNVAAETERAKMGIEFKLSPVALSREADAM